MAKGGEKCVLRVLCIAAAAVLQWEWTVAGCGGWRHVGMRASWQLVMRAMAGSYPLHGPFPVAWPPSMPVGGNLTVSY